VCLCWTCRLGIRVDHTLVYNHACAADHLICILNHVHVCGAAAVDVHKILHIDTLFTAAAIAAVGRSIPSLSQASIYSKFAVVKACWHTASTCLPLHTRQHRFKPCNPDS
jgi:hypothetical protein